MMRNLQPGRRTISGGRPVRGMTVNSVRIRRGLRRDVGSQGRCIPCPGAAGAVGG
jgi:hypothetical protein